jgi:Protein of unknown function (DUF1326)
MFAFDAIDPSTNVDGAKRRTRLSSLAVAMSTIPEWRLVGDWFDICSCNIPCPCEFAQAPTNNACQGMLAWHIREGHYGTVRLDGLNLLALSAFEGNLWMDDDVKARMGLFIDERADAQQREALQMIFTGQAGGWPAGLADPFAWWRATSALGRARRNLLISLVVLASTAWAFTLHESLKMRAPIGDALRGA